MTQPPRLAAQGATRRAARASLAWLAVTAALAALPACGGTYDPPSLINKLRVLAVRADPPVMTTTGPTTLTPLVVGVDEELCFAWALCPFAWSKDGAFQCFDPRLQKDVGTGPTAVVTPAQLFASLAEAPAVFEDLGIKLPDSLKDQQAAQESGNTLELYVMFKVATRASQGGTCPTDIAPWLAAPCADRDVCLAGYKRLAFASKAEDVHSNPTLTGLELGGVAWPEALTPTVGPYKGDPDDTFFGFEKGALELVPTWTDESLETYGESLDPSKPGPLKESLLFSWFSTAGDYDKQRSYDEVPENSLLPPKATDLEMTIWVVVRDGRNGVDWLRRTLRVRNDAPAGYGLCNLDATLPGCP